MSLGSLLKRTKIVVESDREALKPLEEVVNLGTKKDDGHVLRSHVSIPPGRYHVRKNLLVREQATLELKPGVELYLDDRVCIIQNGKMIARGNKKEPIKISGYYDQKFGNIVFFGERASYSRLSHFDISRAKGISFEQILLLSHINEKKIKENSLKRQPGAIVILDSSLKLEQGKIHDNVADTASAIFISGKSSPLISHIHINKNKTQKKGAICNESESTPIIRRCLFTGNSSGSLGGAFTNSGSGLMESCEFSEYNSANIGGAIGLFKGIDNKRRIHTLFFNSVFAFCKADYTAGAMLFENSKLHIQGGMVAHHGIDFPSLEYMSNIPLTPTHKNYNYPDNSPNLFIAKNIRVIGNRATKGGALAAQDSTVNLINSHVLYCFSREGDDGIQLLATPLSYKNTRIQKGSNNLSGGIRSL